jgi:hypothetical protein
MVKFVIGSGKDRQVVVREDNGRLMHEQRRAVKQRLGLLR